MLFSHSKHVVIFLMDKNDTTKITLDLLIEQWTQRRFLASEIMKLELAFQVVSFPPDPQLHLFKTHE